jgi:tRNA(Ile)-lysidine synthase TilS/MesJ
MEALAEDITNESMQYTRNRIRKEVVPVLKQLFPRCAEHVAAI